MRSSFLFKKNGIVSATLALFLSLVMALTASANNNVVWLTAGQGRTNWRYQPLESTISNQNVANLGVKWSATGADVSATPSVSDGIVYYPDWAGNLYARNATTGALVWQVNLATLSGISGALSRATPTIDGSNLYVGLQNQGWMLAINRNKGTLVWKTQMDSHPAAIITQSPADYNGMLFVGVASLEEAFAANPSYPCCTFRGSLSAVDEKTGHVIWKTYMAPDNGGMPGGYSGNAVWGSTPVVDPSSKLVYIGTGNNYTVPADVAAGTASLSASDYVDSLLALNIYTGQVAWVAPHLGLTADTWNVACFSSEPGIANCPDPAGPDYDFGQGPMQVSLTINGVPRNLIIDGQKSGKLWALDASTGQQVWMYDSGVGSTLGGMEWGSATDGKTVYFANAAGGFWGAVDIATGQLKWKTYDPNMPSAPIYTTDTGAVSVANGVVYAGSLANSNSAANTMFALDANTGTILWQFSSGSSVASGAAIVNGMVFWGTGYGHFGLGAGVPAGGPAFFAFGLP